MSWGVKASSPEEPGQNEYKARHLTHGFLPEEFVIFSLKLIYSLQDECKERCLKGQKYLKEFYTRLYSIADRSLICFLPIPWRI